MKIVRQHDFGGVTGWELGWSPVGRPVMTAFFYVAGPVMIDTGLRHMRPQALSIASKSSIRAILLTHYHEDHSGNAAAISESLDIDVYGHPLTVQKLAAGYAIYPYQHLMWGRPDPVNVRPVPGVWEQNGLRLEAVYTPGHSRDHISYLNRENGKAAIRKKLQYLEDFYGNVSRLAAQGMDENGIMRRLGLKEQHRIKLMCFGNVSMKNMVRSVIQAESRKNPHKD